MDFKAILNNKPVLFGIIGGVVLIVAIVIIMAVSGGGKNAESEPKIKEPLHLLTTTELGKTIELQALLATKGIHAERESEGSKHTLIMRDYTMSQRDMALLAIVKSGLMDKNIGLEVFDKGDFTSSREDKRIRLARAIDGELSRLIRKMEGIEDASVFVSIPEQTIFVGEKKPTTATVQVTIPSGSKLDRDKVRAITNLLMGSIQEIEAKNISITDTNGNVYSSLMSPEDDMMTLLEEKDKYMKDKVQAQLDRLLGKGNYVVTVSTYLREAPLETAKLSYNPNESTVSNRQQFTETLGDSSQDQNKISSAVSTFIPGGLSQTPSSSSNRNYSRTAEEYQYGTGKTQTTEVRKPGMIEEISIAVTVDQNSMPSGMAIQDLKELVAKSANPKATGTNVEIAFADMSTPILSSERPVQLPKPEDSGNPWWVLAVVLGLFLLAGLIFISERSKRIARRQQEELNALLERNQMQENQLLKSQESTARLQSMYEQLQNALSSGQSLPALANLQEVIMDIKENVEDNVDEGEFAVKLKSWIEAS